MKILKFEEKLIEFLDIKSDEKFSESGLACFSNGSSAGSWFYLNKDKIFALNNEFSKRILKEYNIYIEKKEAAIARKKELIKNNVEKFERYCNIFYNIKDDGKYNKDKDVKLVGELLAYDWFNANINRIMRSTYDICNLIKKDYLRYKVDERKAKLIEERKKVYEFFCEKNNNKFQVNSNLKFKDGTLMYKWFLNNIDKIINSNELIYNKIYNQYELYLFYLELKNEFYNHPNLEKYDENSNVRFKSGALMCFFFEQYFNDILNSNTKIDKLIIDDYKKYIMIKDLYYDEEDLVLKKY